MSKRKWMFLAGSLLLAPAAACLADDAPPTDTRLDALLAQMSRTPLFTPAEFDSLIRTLTPQAYEILSAPGQTLRLATPDPLLLFTPGSPEPVLVLQGEVLRPGVYWNISDAPASFTIGDSSRTREIASLGLLALDAIRSADSTVASGPLDAWVLSCSVTCGADYYACCICGLTGARCRCVHADVTTTCAAGGTGSSQCSITCPEPEE